MIKKIIFYVVVRLLNAGELLQGYLLGEYLHTQIVYKFSIKFVIKNDTKLIL